MSAHIMIDTFVLDSCFNCLIRGSEVYYWRECVQRNGMQPDEVGYVIVYADGSHLHTYHHPESFL